MTTNIEGKVVVITGASSGLGEATARHLSARGAKLVLAARRLDRLQALARELELDATAAVETDVTDVEQVKALIDGAVAQHGRIDVLLNNAGLMPQSLLERLRIDEWEQMIDVNLKGVLYGIAAALPHMIKAQSGHIINVSSVAGHKVRQSNAVYAATKIAVRMLSEGLRMEMKPHNVRTTVISPGVVATDLPNSTRDPEASGRVRQFYDEVAIPADAFARAVAYAIEQPDEVEIDEILFRPTAQEF